ncbi:MAG: NAD-dependent epimerase/dehydratase family protein [Deltaproteobacteria bacterium]
MKILITGATGFIGGRLAAELATKGHELVCLVRKTSDTAGLRRLGAGLAYGDVCDESSLSSLPRCDAIVHCAAVVDRRPLKQLRSCNVEGTRNICEAAMRTGARLVHLSSVAVVTGNSAVTLTEDMAYAPTNTYGVSKMEAERVVLGYRGKGLKCAVIRPPMVYGEGEPHALGKLMWLIRRGMFPLLDEGRTLLHMVYVGNLAHALCLALDRGEFLEGTFFAADTDALTCAEAFGILASSVDAPRPPLVPRALTPVLTRLPFVGKPLASLFKDRVYETKRIRSVGYSDIVPAREALKRAGSFYK